MTMMMMFRRHHARLHPAASAVVLLTALAVIAARPAGAYHVRRSSDVGASHRFGPAAVPPRTAATSAAPLVGVGDTFRGGAAGLYYSREETEYYVDNQLEELEERIGRKIDEQSKKLNQSIAIQYLEKVLDYIGEETQLNRELLTSTQDDRQRQIDQLRRELERQRHDLDRSTRTIADLTKLVANLTERIEVHLAAADKPLLLQPQQLSTQVSAGGSIGANPSSTSAVATNKFPIDCQEAYEAETVNVDGHQRRVPEGFQYPTIEPRGSRDPFKACCKVLDNRTSWTVIQRRQDGSVDFYRNWSAYKAGFGHVEGEFWIGNERLHHLTSQGDYRLRVEMVTWDDQPHWAEYEYFRVSSEADKYRLHVTGFVAGGDAGDSLTSAWDNDHNGQPFSTYDSDNDARYYDNCAQHYRGAWWFHSCFQSHLNGVYYQRGTHSNFFVRNGIQWNTIHPHSSLRRVVMMVRRNDDVTAAGGGSTSSGDILSNGVE